MKVIQLIRLYFAGDNAFLTAAELGKVVEFITMLQRCFKENVNSLKLTLFTFSINVGLIMGDSSGHAILKKNIDFHKDLLSSKCNNSPCVQ